MTHIFLYLTIIFFIEITKLNFNLDKKKYNDNKYYFIHKDIIFDKQLNCYVHYPMSPTLKPSIYNI